MSELHSPYCTKRTCLRCPPHIRHLRCMHQHCSQATPTQSPHLPYLRCPPHILHLRCMHQHCSQLPGGHLPHPHRPRLGSVHTCKVSAVGAPSQYPWQGEDDRSWGGSTEHPYRGMAYHAGMGRHHSAYERSLMGDPANVMEVPKDPPTPIFGFGRSKSGLTEGSVAGRSHTLYLDRTWEATGESV